MESIDLTLIAARLEGLEETIIHRLIDRAQFATNPAAYDAGTSGFPDFPDRSLFEVRLRFQEEMDARFGRYRVPEERPYFRDLPKPQRAVNLPSRPLVIDDLNQVNVTPDIVDAYLKALPELCADESGRIDDKQYGSSVEHDVLAIQAIARRVHFGALYVAESKYHSDPEQYAALIRQDDVSGIERLITRPEVEERILRRVAEKVDYIQATANRTVRRVISPQTVLGIYQDLIIPLTKRGEVRYLYQRLRLRSVTDLAEPQS
jgi:chorismate mutase